MEYQLKSGEKCTKSGPWMAPGPASKMLTRQIVEGDTMPLVEGKAVRWVYAGKK